MPEKQAQIEVSLPAVKIRLEDLSYLRGLLDAERTNKRPCVSSTRSDRALRVLGLIEDVEIAPCPDDLHKHNRTIAEAKRRVKAAIKREPWDWDAISGVKFWDIRNGKPKPRKVTGITAAGKKLLAEGIAKASVKAPR